MVTVVGHRGAAGHAPENTLLSFAAALELGCSWAECDVRLSKDGHVIVLHDQTIDRTTNGNGNVNEMSLEEIKRFHTEFNQEIPTLDEILSFCKNKINVQIELKEDCAKEVIELVKKHGMEKNVLIMSFDFPFLEKVKELSQLQTGFLFDSFIPQVWKDVEELKVGFICPKGDIIDGSIIKDAHNRKIKVYAWHVDDQLLGEQLIAWGVDAIGSDLPDLFL